MQLDDLKQDWQQTINTHAKQDNLDEVITMLEKETQKIDKEIKRRDILEISIAIFLIPFWIYGWLNTAGLMQSVGFAIAIGSCIYIPYKLILAKKTKPQKSTSVKDFLTTEKQKVKQQKQLLESIVWWYIAPIAAAIVFITLGSTVNESGMPQLNDSLITYYGFLILLVVGIYFLNRQAAKKKFGPLLEKIEQRLNELNH